MINYGGILSHYFELCASVNPLKLIIILSVFRDRGEHIVLLTMLRDRVDILQDVVPVLLLCLIHNNDSLTSKTQASKSISRRCCVIAGFKLYSHIQYFSNVIFLLSFFAHQCYHLTLNPRARQVTETEAYMRVCI